MARLHIVQGSHKDKEWLERAAPNHWRAPSWTVPKSACIGDEVMIYVRGYGIVATARVNSEPKRRRGWHRRYGAGLNSIKLVEPAISLAAIRRHIPNLKWAIYPRSVTTPKPSTAALVKKLVSERREKRMPDLDKDALAEANIDELRKVALLRARQFVKGVKRTVIYRARSLAIHLYVLRRADGRCESCKATAPFRKADGSPYLEPHHTTRLADDGPDHPAKVISLCPACHRRAHYSADAMAFNRSLIKKLRRLESRRT